MRHYYYMPDFPEKARQIHSFELDDSLVLAKPGQEGLFLLSPISRYIWESLRLGLTVQEIAADLANAFGKDRVEIESDVEHTVREWETTVFAPTRAALPDSAPPAPATWNSASARIFDFSIYRRRFRLRISDPVLEAEIRQRFGPFEVHSDGFVPQFTFDLALSDAGYIIKNSEGLVVPSDHLVGAARVDLINAIIKICFPHREWLACLHAAALGKDDRCILLSAPSGGGKSTLSAAMIASGLKLITDDLAYLDSQKLEISGLPLAIMAREGSWNALRSAYPEIHDLPVHWRDCQSVRFLHGTAEEDPVPVKAAALFFLDYQGGAAPEVMPLSNFDALAKIDQTNSWINPLPVKLQKFLGWLQTVPKYRLTYSNVADAMKLASTVLHW